MNRKVTVGLMVSLFILVLAFPVFAASQWYKINSGVTSDLLHCAFYNDEIGWAVGTQGTILRTQDGGNSWQRITPTPGRTYTSVSVTNPLSNEAWTTDSLGGIIHWTFGSPTTFELQKTSSSGLNDICMTEQTDGFAVGNTGIIYRYMGPVAGWVQKTHPNLPHPYDQSGYDYYGISSLGGSPNAEVAVGAQVPALGGVALYTNNYGDNWILGSLPKTHALRKVSYTTYRNVYAAGDAGVYRSTDGGAHWNDFNDGIFGITNFKDIYFINSSEGWVVGEKGIYYVNNSTHWNNVTPSTWQNEVLNGVFARQQDSDHAWAVGQGGSIYVYSPTTPPSLLPASVEVSVVNSFESVSLSWTSASGATSYQVYRSQKSNALGVNQGTIKLSDDFSGTSLDLTKWATVEMAGSFDIFINGGRLEVSGTGSSTGKEFCVGGLSGRNILANTAKLIELSADVDLSHGIGYPVFGSPSLLTIGSESGIVPYLGKGSATQYAIGCLLGGKEGTIILDAAANSAGNLKMLQANNYASIFFSGAYKGKIPSNLSSASGLNYMLLGFCSRSISMDIFFDNFKAVEYPLILLTDASAPTTSYVDTNVATGETYFYTVVPVNAGGYSSGSNVIEVTVTGTPPPVIPPTSVTGVVSVQGGEINLTIHSNGVITIGSSAVGGTPVSITVFGTGWSDKLDSSSATSIQQNQAGDITIKWTASGKISTLDKGIYPTMLRVGNITQKIYLVKY